MRLREWFLWPVLAYLNHLKTEIQMTLTELLAAIGDVNNSLDIIGQETAALQAQIRQLEDALALAGVVDVRVEAAIAALRAKAKAIDDLVPDPLPTSTTPEVPAAPAEPDPETPIESTPPATDLPAPTDPGQPVDPTPPVDSVAPAPAPAETPTT